MRAVTQRLQQAIVLFGTGQETCSRYLYEPAVQVQEDLRSGDSTIGPGRSEAARHANHILYAGFKASAGVSVVMGWSESRVELWSNVNLGTSHLSSW